MGHPQKGISSQDRSLSRSNPGRLSALHAIEISSAAFRVSPAITWSYEVGNAVTQVTQRIDLLLRRACVHTATTRRLCRATLCVLSLLPKIKGAQRSSVTGVGKCL